MINEKTKPGFLFGKKRIRTFKEDEHDYQKKRQRVEEETTDDEIKLKERMAMVEEMCTTDAVTGELNKIKSG